MVWNWAVSLKLRFAGVDVHNARALFTHYLTTPLEFAAAVFDPHNSSSVVSMTATHVSAASLPSFVITLSACRSKRA